MKDLLTTEPQSQRTLAELVAENPARAVVFDRMGLDFCCHGNRSLSEACSAARLDADEVLAALDTVPEVPRAWMGGGRGELAGYIEATHHSYLHAELDSLIALAEKVASVHGSRHPELREVTRLVSELAADLRPHLAAEEGEVFPAIASLEPGTAGDGRLAARIGDLVAEHTAVGAQLATLRGLTDGYSTPEDGCASYRSLFDRLGQLEADTHLHIHLENNILFPAALVEAI